MTTLFCKAAAEPINWALRERCPHCKRVGGEQRVTHIGVGYGVCRQPDGSEKPVRLVLMHGCEWHMRMWTKGRLVDHGR